jgi:lipoyl synthase
VFGDRRAELPTKSGLMLGLGETPAEVIEVMRDLREVGCDLLTLGQYLRPSPAHLAVSEFVEPAIFEELARQGRALGFSAVASAPFVRSSYHAKELVDQASG